MADDLSPVIAERMSDEIVELLDVLNAAGCPEARQQAFDDWKYEARYRPSYRHYKFIPLFASLRRHIRRADHWRMGRI